MAGKVFLLTVLADSLTVKAHASAKGLASNPDGGVYLVADKADVEKVPVAVLLRAFNATRSKPVSKFPGKVQAIDKGWEAIQMLGHDGTEAKDEPKAAKAPKAPKEPKGPKLVTYEPDAEKIKAARAGSKVALMIDRMSQPGGIELSALGDELSKTGKAVNIRSWLGYDLHKVHGYGVTSEVRDGNIFVSLKLPKGMKAPLAHRVKEEAPAKKEAKAAVQEEAVKSVAKGGGKAVKSPKVTA